jgi:hypothetical protein
MYISEVKRLCMGDGEIIWRAQYVVKRFDGMVNWYGVCMGHGGHVHDAWRDLADDGVSVRPEYD